MTTQTMTTDKDAIIEAMIARRVKRGNRADESRVMLDELLRIHGAGTLASALYYWDFATAAKSEEFAAILLDS